VHAFQLQIVERCIAVGCILNRCGCAATLVVKAIGPCERRNKNGCRPRLQERPGCGARGSAGGEDVVDDQNIPAIHCGWVSDFEGAADVDTTLAWSESSLAAGGPLTDERTRRESELPLRMAFTQRAQGMLRERPGLIESALSMLGAEERHGNDEHLSGCFGGELADRFGQHLAEFAGSGVHAVVFERVEGRAHAILVGSVGYGAHKRRRRQATDSAEARAGTTIDWGI
jgi:hypothetical protein